MLPSLTNLQPLDYDSDVEENEDYSGVRLPHVSQKADGAASEFIQEQKGGTEIDLGRLQQRRPQRHDLAEEGSGSPVGANMPSLGHLQPLNYDSDKTTESPSVLPSASVSASKSVQKGPTTSLPDRREQNENKVKSRVHSPFSDMRSVQRDEQRRAHTQQQSEHSYNHTTTPQSVDKRYARLASFTSSVFQVDVPKT